MFQYRCQRSLSANSAISRKQFSFQPAAADAGAESTTVLVANQPSWSSQATPGTGSGCSSNDTAAITKIASSIRLSQCSIVTELTIALLNLYIVSSLDAGSDLKRKKIETYTSQVTILNQMAANDWRAGLAELLTKLHPISQKSIKKRKSAGDDLCLPQFTTTQVVGPRFF
jgi:hypothetical protein